VARRISAAVVEEHSAHDLVVARWFSSSQAT
jgi:hypothetical protein